MALDHYPNARTDLTEKVIGCAIEVHKELGPGLLESIYESCMAMALEDAGLKFERQKQLPVFFKGRKIDKSYCLDLIVEDDLIIELKAIERLLPIHEAQILTYMRLTNKSLGLLINFNDVLLKNGLKRMTLKSKMNITPSSSTPCSNTNFQLSERGI